MCAAIDKPDSDQTAVRHQRSRFHRSVLIAFVLALSGCASLEQHPTPPGDGAADTQVLPPAIDATPAPSVADSDAGISASPEPPTISDDTVWPRLRSGFRLKDIQHPRVAREIKRLQRSPNAFRGLMARAEPYLYHILNAVEQAGLPTELALLPAVESGFQAHVYSPSGAAGLWQFMPATAQMLGLQQDWWFDRRRTVRAATDAAIEYLNLLNRRFDGDWLYTLAAYNAGAGTVARAIRRARDAGTEPDYWTLDLPAETDMYIPRLLALAAIVADPDAFGLDLPEIADRPYFTVVATAGQIDLNVAAELADIPVEDLLVLNAGHKRWASRPDGPHELLLPVEVADRFVHALADLPAENRLRWQRHRIRAGDSLIRIARQYGVTVEAIQRSNGLTSARIRAGRDLLIPLSDSVTFASARSTGHSRQRLRYRVRKGDSLYRIAQRFQVSIADLQRWNRVGRYLQPGDSLTVFIDPDA